MSLRLLIQKAFDDSDGTYGVPAGLVAAGPLGRAAGGPELVRALMRGADPGSRPAAGAAALHHPAGPGRADP